MQKVTLKSGVLPAGVATTLDWVAYSWLGVALHLFVALLVRTGAAGR